MRVRRVRIEQRKNDEVETLFAVLDLTARIVLHSLNPAGTVGLLKV